MEWKIVDKFNLHRLSLTSSLHYT